MATLPDRSKPVAATADPVVLALADCRARRCPICGDRGRPVLFSDAKLDRGALDSFAFASRKTPELMHHRLVRCLRCDLVYADPAPTGQYLDRAYLEASFDSAVEAAHASRTYGRVLDRVLSRLPSRDGALDIGTGDGSFLEQLQSRGFTDIGGVEPSAAPVRAAAARVRPLIHHGPFGPELRLPYSLSLVTCFQTIEHLPDPLTFAMQARTLLRPGGALLLVAHNRRALSARLLGERSPIFDVEHLQLFSMPSAVAMLRRAGFVAVSGWVIINRYPLSYWMRLSPLPQRVKAATLSALSSSPLHGVALPLPAGNMAVVGFRPSTEC